MGKVVRGTFTVKPVKVKPGEEKGGIGRYKIFQLKITLAESRPPIWRRVLLSGNTTFAKLHRIIQVLILWEDCHLHQFIVNGTRYTMSNPEESEPYRDEKRYRLYQAGLEKGMTFLYIYDYGDDWVHTITVEEILESDDRFNGKPLCIGGAMSGPPEDVGGIYGYYEMLKAAGNKRHPDHETAREWLEDFDPKAFGIVSINMILKRLR